MCTHSCHTIPQRRCDPDAMTSPPKRGSTHTHSFYSFGSHEATRDATPYTGYTSQIFIVLGRILEPCVYYRKGLGPNFPHFLHKSTPYKYILYTHTHTHTHTHHTHTPLLSPSPPPPPPPPTHTGSCSQLHLRLLMSCSCRVRSTNNCERSS